MPIGFKCPKCGKALRTAKDKAGSKGRCPFCRSVFAVPSPSAVDRDADVFSLAVLQSLAQGEELDEPATSAPAPTAPAVAPAAARVSPPARSARPGGIGAFAADCLAAFLGGLRDLPNIFILLLGLGLVAAGLTALYVFAGALILHTTPGLVLMVLLGFVLLLTLGGYLFRYSLDVTVAGIEGRREGTPPPQWAFGEQVVTALRAIGLVVVYVVPLVTLPLLPLGLLALARARDGRAFNLIWAVRAAAKRPLHLAMLWCILLLWEAAGWVGVVVAQLLVAAVAGALAAAGALGIATTIAVGLLATLLLGTVAMVFGCIQCRCAGLLGHHSPELLRMLPEFPNALTSLGFVGAGLVLGVLVSAGIGSALNGSDFWSGEGAIRSIARASRGGSDKERLAESNYRAIAEAIERYRKSHGGRLPPSLEVLVEERLLDRDCLLCSGNPLSTPCYLHVSPNAPGETVLVWEPIIYGLDKMFAVCLDGKVRTWGPEEMERRLRAQRAKLYTATWADRGPLPQTDKSYYHAWRAMQEVADKQRALRRKRRYCLPASLGEFARAIGVNDRELASFADAGRSYVYVPEAARCREHRHIMLYDPATYRRKGKDVSIALTCRSLVDTMTPEQLRRRLATEAGERRERAVSYAREALYRAAQALREYAERHGERLPASLDEMAAAMDMSRLCLTSVGDPGKRYVYVRPPDGSYRDERIVLYDPFVYDGKMVVWWAGRRGLSWPITEQELRKRLAEQASPPSPRPRR